MVQLNRFVAVDFGILPKDVPLQTATEHELAYVCRLLVHRYDELRERPLAARAVDLRTDLPESSCTGFSSFGESQVR